MDEDLEDDELTIAVVAAVGSSALERDGMLRRLEEAVTLAVVEIAVQGYLTSGSVDDGEVRLVIAAPGLAAPDVLSMVGDRVAELISDPDLPGWGPFSVKVTDESDDDEDVELDLRLESLPEDDAGSLDPLADDFDTARVRRQLIRDAAHLAGGLDLEWLTILDTHSHDPQERAEAVAEAQYVAGAIFQASVVVLEHLFTDVLTLRLQPVGASVATCSGEVFFALDELPPRYAHRYDAGFAQELIVATVDATVRLTAGWEPLACVAQELSIRLVLNQVEVQLALAQVQVQEGWRAAVEDALFEDLDHEMLFEPGTPPGTEAGDDSPFLADLRAGSMAFGSWFIPFDSDRHLPPYLLESRQQP